MYKLEPEDDGRGGVAPSWVAKCRRYPSFRHVSRSSVIRSQERRYGVLMTDLSLAAERILNPTRLTPAAEAKSAPASPAYTAGG